MANLCRVITSGDIPEEIAQLNCVKWYGDNPIKSTENTILSNYGTIMIYTCRISEVIDKLIELGFDNSTIFYQDLDGYGDLKIFQREIINN